MNMKKALPMIIVALVIAGGSFFAGIQYQKSVATNAGQRDNFANLTPEQRQARLQQFGQNGGGFRGGNGAGGGITAGDILSKDATSLTIKLRDGGSKIIFLSDKTQVMKTTDGSATDLTVGQQVSVQGTANPDGSISAQSIQIRPPLPANSATNTTTSR